MFSFLKEFHLQDVKVPCFPQSIMTAYSYFCMLNWYLVWKEERHGWVGTQRNLSMHPDHLSSRDIVSDRLLGIVLVSVWPLRGPLPRHSQQRVLSKGRSAALRLPCFSCLLNASSSEAMILLKPLKELRAKRKGTRLYLCACVLLSSFVSICLFFMRVFLSAKKDHIYLSFSAGSLVLFACFAAVC